METQSVKELIFELSEKLKYILKRKEELEIILKKNSDYLIYLNILQEYELLKDTIKENKLKINDENEIETINLESVHEELDIISSKTCNYYNISFKEINKKSDKGKLLRFRKYKDPRHIIYFIAKYTKHDFGVTYQSISEYYFGQDHATMINAIKRISNLFTCPNERELRLTLMYLCKKLNYYSRLKKEFNL